MNIKNTFYTFLITIQFICNANAIENDNFAPKTDSINREEKYQFHSLGNCHFSIEKTSMGWYAEEGGYLFHATNTENTKGILFFCFEGASIAEIEDLLGAKKLKGQWYWTASNAPFEANQHFRPYEFSGVNWSGIGNTIDEITGEEALRQRFFNFCLLQNNGPQVLCLYNVPIMNLNHPESNILNKIISVVKSIAFVNLGDL